MRQAFAAALRHPVSRIGVALTTASALLFLFLLALQLVGILDNPYTGLVVFVMVPAFFVVGLILIPIGLSAERRRAATGAAAPAWPRLDLNDAAIRRTVFLLAGATLLNLALVSVASYGAVEYTASQSFCGQVCHEVMEPEFVAHQNGAHASVSCVTCHVGPGAGGFVAAKLSGLRQLMLVTTGRYARPIPVPERMPDVGQSCEGCHWPDRFVGDIIKVLYEHADDEAVTQTATTVRLHVGGPVAGTGTGTGIHWHMDRANVIEYIALDEQREQIGYIRVTGRDGRTREYFADGVDESALAGRPRRRMDCLDCHNRPAHRFGSSPERAVDAAIGAGQISRGVPFVRREAVRALRAEYPSQEAAFDGIARAMREGVEGAAAGAVDEAALRHAIAVTQAIYRTNVFPSMKVGWGTYPSHIGHMESPGCFRCHDDSHQTRDGLAVRQDCEMCHTIE